MMDFFGGNAPEHLDVFVTSLGIGLLLGLERERHTDPKAGVRTFALVALLGTLAAMIVEKTGSAWVIASGLIAVATMMIAANLADQDESGDPGTTSVVALMICYCLGIIVWFGNATLAVMLAIATTTLLYFKSELHGFTYNLTRKDLISILQFSVLTFVVLPILPDRNFGPYAALNLHQIWLMVVLIAGVSLSGYAALRIIGARHGAAVIGFFGGLVSSTATTMVFARHARNQADLTRTAAVVILLANLMVMLRLGLLTLFVTPRLALALAPVLCGGLLLGLIVTAYGWRSLGAHEELPMPEVSNPTELSAALGFGLIYAIILVCAAWLEDLAGSKGLYVVALISGITDVDAITLSSLHLFDLDKLNTIQAVTSITLAILANLIFKAGLIVSIGGATLARQTLPGMAAIGIGISLGLTILST